jgi:hypothetical protein
MSSTVLWAYMSKLESNYPGGSTSLSEVLLMTVNRSQYRSSRCTSGHLGTKQRNRSDATLRERLFSLFK